MSASPEKEESPTEMEESLENNSPLDFFTLHKTLSRQSSKKSLKSSGLRSRSQSRISEDNKEDVGEQNATNNSFERKKREEKVDQYQEDPDYEPNETREVPLLNLSKSKSKSNSQSIKFAKLEVTTAPNLLGADLSPNLDPSPLGNGGGFPLKRSNTSQIFLGSPLLSISRRSSKKGGDLIDSFQKRVNDSQTLTALRERLEKIKLFQTLIKGYDIILQYAKNLDTFNEFSTG